MAVAEAIAGQIAREIAPDPAARTPITPETTGTEFESATDKGRQIRIELDPATSQVTIINAGDKTWLKALQGLKL